MPKSNRISVLIVDDIADTRVNIQKLLLFEKDIEVIGTAADGRQAIEAARKLVPDIVVMDITMPGLDGISAVEGIRALGIHSQVIMMSVQEEQEFLRKSMLAGAREFLVKPFSGDELSLAIRRVYERSDRPSGAVARFAVAEPEPQIDGRIVTLFSPKGGVGRTTLACNLAVALQQSGKTVAIVDCSLAFGDVGILLNIQPTKTIIDLLPHVASLDPDHLHELLLHNPLGIDVLLAPISPEMAELVTADALKRILSKLRECYDYVIVDTAPSFDDNNLGVLDISDQILAPLTLEMPAIKNMRLFLEVAGVLGYSKEKIQLILNRSNSTGGIEPKEIEARLGRPIAAKIISDGKLTTLALNQGTPFVVLKRNSPLSKNVFELAHMLISEQKAASARANPEPEEETGIATASRGLFRLPWRTKATA